MKKIVICSVVLVAVFVMASPVFAVETDIDPNPSSDQCVSLSYNLRYRARDTSTNGEVSTLQDFLNTNNYLKTEPTGYFGLMTVSAVKSFQSANNILASGYVGPITRAKIKTLSCGGGVALFSVPLTTSSSTLYTTLDIDSPVSKSVVGGSLNVLATVLKFNTGAEGVNLKQIALQFDGSNVNALQKYTVWDGTTKTGEGFFLGTTTSTVILNTPIYIGAYSSKKISIKVDLYNTGIGDPAKVGDTVAINYDGHRWQSTFGTGAVSGGTIYSNSKTDTNAYKITLASSSTSTPSLTVLSPNGGEVMEVGSTQTITWKPVSGFKTGLNLLDVSTGLASTGLGQESFAEGVGSYRWTIPSTQKVGNYKIQAYLCRADSTDIECQNTPIDTYSLRADHGHDESDAPFSIIAATPVVVPAVDITISGSSGPVLIKYGDPIAVIWKSTNASYCQGEGFGWKGTNYGIWGSMKLPVFGSEFFYPASNPAFTAGAVVEFKIACFSDVGSNIARDGVVGNISVPPAPFVTVLSPNGGEAWQFGTSKELGWQGNGASYDIFLVLSAKTCLPSMRCSQPVGELIYTIAQNITGSKYLWNAGVIGKEQYVTSGTYYLKVCISGTNTCDSSNSTFSLTSASAVSNPLNQTASILGSISSNSSPTVNAEEIKDVSDWCHTFNDNLKLNDEGKEVEALQTALNKDDFNVPSTGFFGNQTFSVVSGFQEKYANEVLAPLGLTSGTGIVGLKTRAKLNTLFGCE